jgi:PEGA domain-containing protein
MSLSRLSLIVVASLCVAGPLPAHAAQRGGHSRGGGGGGSHAVSRSAPTHVSAPRAGSVSRAVGPSRVIGPSRTFSAGPRTVYAQSRGGAVARGPRGVGPRGVGPRGVGPRYVGPRVIGRGYYTPYRFYRPYYSFRPRFSIGFGLWVGYPIGYPYYDPYYYPYGYSYPYGYPYGYSYPYSAPPPPAYGYAPQQQGYGYAPPQGYAQGTVGVRAGTSAEGGVSFEITPNSAEIYVDGQLAGSVNDFTPSSAPLSLTPGRHRVEIRAQGYQVMTFDADVVAGQVVPYRGTLQPIR